LAVALVAGVMMLCVRSEHFQKLRWVMQRRLLALLVPHVVNIAFPDAMIAQDFRPACHDRTMSTPACPASAPVTASLAGRDLATVTDMAADIVEAV